MHHDTSSSLLSDFPFGSPLKTADLHFEWPGPGFGGLDYGTEGSFHLRVPSRRFGWLTTFEENKKAELGGVLPFGCHFVWLRWDTHPMRQAQLSRRLGWSRFIASPEYIGSSDRQRNGPKKLSVRSRIVAVFGDVGHEQNWERAIWQNHIWLVGGLEHEFYFPNWRTHIFQGLKPPTGWLWSYMESLMIL